MEAGQIVVVLLLVIVVPIAFAWAQSRWEISRERRAARRTTGSSLRHRKLAIRRSPRGMVSTVLHERQPALDASSQTASGRSRSMSGVGMSTQQCGSLCAVSI